MSVAWPPAEDSNPESKRGRMEVPPVLSFSNDNKVGTLQPHNDALVVTLRIEGYDVKRVLVDHGSDVEIMYLDLYEGLTLKPEDLVCYDSPLVGFDGKVVIPRGQIRLPVQAGSEVVEVDFIIVDAYSPYIIIVARSWLHALRAVSSTLHLKVKYPSGDGVEELVGSQSIARQCLVAAIRHQAGGEIFRVGVQLPPWEKEELIVFLWKNIDVFAWDAYEAPGMDLSFICHHLNGNPSVIPKKQPPQHSSKNHSDAIKEEVIRLKRAGAIKDVFYPE
ncbi:uncharacterized protein LOC112023871 [Quercus suber]|uniref:uncharacterized protein LOC112023871 n=1 Tax=Quercus suber TaxID=58331 RepID=UPI000CE16D1D|nr:uncharacterized protein LOC112023871 [Quercus suber]